MLMPVALTNLTHTLQCLIVQTLGASQGTTGIQTLDLRVTRQVLYPFAATAVQKHGRLKIT